jgi:hairless
MSLYFHRPSTLLPIDECLKFAKLKRRRPHDKKIQTHRVKKIVKNEGTERSNNTQNSNENENSQPSSEPTANIPSTNPVPHDATGTNNKLKSSSVKNRSTLTSIVKKLSEKNPTVISQNARMSQLSISNHHHVSPRKRILRELEKVSLEDITTMKRSRAKTTVMSNSIPSVSVAAHIKSPSSRNVNGNSTSEMTSLSPSIQQSSSRPISSYSITSLLGHNSESSKNSSNNNNYRKEQPLSATAASHQHNKDYEYNRNMKSSPKSPEQIPQKMYSSVAHISSGRKRSSPIYHPHSPSPISSDQSVNKQSPNLSSSPEQQQQNLNKYRQHPYNYNSLHNMMNSPSVSSPNYTIPSRYSPSPNAENYSQKYRSTYLSSNSPSATYNNSFPGMNNSSPSHQLLIKRESPIATSSSPSALSFSQSSGGGGSSNHRKSPPQNYIKFVDSPTHQVNFHPHFSHYQAAKEKDRDVSPSMSPKKQDYPIKYEKYTTSTSTSSSSSQQSGGFILNII